MTPGWKGWKGGTLPLYYVFTPTLSSTHYLRRTAGEPQVQPPPARPKSLAT